jgi:ABC-type branched-subunit amino acid transport system substrate-binding protein
VKKLLFVTLVVVLLAGLILGGCAKPAPTTPTTPTTPTPTPPTPQKVLKIGQSQAFNTPAGLQDKKWMDLFAKLYNDAGGWEIGGEKYKVEMICYDNQNDQAKAKNDLERLVFQDGCKIILRGTQSPLTDVLVTDPNKVLVCGEDVTDQDSDPKIQYWFGGADTFWGRACTYIIDKDFLAKGAKTKVEVKQDNMMGHIFAGLLEPSAKAAGFTILPTVYYDPSTSDFGPIATKVKSLNPDVVGLMYNENWTAIMASLRDVGWKGFFVLGIPVESSLSAVYTKVGKEYVEGAEGVVQDPTGYQKDPRMLSLLDAYAKEYGKLEFDDMLFTSRWFVLEDAINATQSVDPDVLKKYLENSPPASRTMLGFTQLFARPDKKNYRTTVSAMGHQVGIVKDGNWVAFQAVTVKDMYLFTIKLLGWGDTYKKYWEEYGYPTFPAEEKGKNTLNYSDFGISGQD